MSSLPYIAKALETNSDTKWSRPYSVISTTGVGVPLHGEGEYQRRVAAALSELRYRHGWKFVCMLTDTDMLFEKES